MNQMVFDRILKEHFDTSNRKSIRTLLSLNETEQNQAMVALASKLYEKIVDKVDDIDFGTIPASRGDITKIGNFQELRECITVMGDILNHYKQDTVHLETVDKAIENLKASKATWEKAFAVDCEMAITFYNTISLSIVSAVSLLISSSIDFIKEPGNQSFQISFDKAGYTKTKDKLLFQNLEKFNKAYIKGDITKTFDAIIKANSSLKESANMYGDEVVKEDVALYLLVGVVGAGMFVSAILTVIIPILHELVSILYCVRQDISEYFDVQSKLVQFNAEQLKYNYTKSDKELKKVYDKQMKIANTFKKISDAFAIKMNKAEAEAKQDIKQEKSQKYNVDDLEVKDAPTITSVDTDMGSGSSLF